MKRAYFSMILIALTVFCAQAQQLSVDAAVQGGSDIPMAVSITAYRDSVASYSWTLKSAAMQSVRGYELMLREKTGFLPSLSASASYSKTFHHIGQNELWGLAVEPQIAQTLYGGGVRASYRQAAANYDQALYGEKYNRLSVRYSADYAYWSVSAMQLFRKAVEEYVTIIESLYKVVEERFNEGYIAKSDLLQVETRLSEARFDEITAQQNYHVALHRFNLLRGDGADDDVALSESIVDSIVMPSRVSLAEMLARRPDLSAAEAAIAAAEYGVGITRAAYNPRLTVGVGGSWRTYVPNATGRTYLDAAVTVGLNVPIFHWGERHRAVAASTASADISRSAYSQACDDAAREEADGWSALVSSYSQMQSSLDNLKTAGENLSISTYSYNEGQATVLDVLQAQIGWIQVYTNAITARFNYAVAVSAYKRITAAD